MELGIVRSTRIDYHERGLGSTGGIQQLDRISKKTVCDKMAVEGIKATVI